MDNLGCLFVSAHNSRIAGDIQAKLNEFVEAINRAGGKCWLQSKSNKEHYYMLTEPVYFNYYVPIDNESFSVNVNSVNGVVEENNHGSC